MQVILNGKPHPLADGSTVQTLLDELGLAGKRIAVEVNEQIVTRSTHACTALQAGDRIEIVQAIGGG